MYSTCSASEMRAVVLASLCCLVAGVQQADSPDRLKIRKTVTNAIDDACGRCAIVSPQQQQHPAYIRD
uniref:Putative secreted protein n=1 Tax=Anopheles triannulatus TaxID=58253 RepID=A0A2M4B821_9DIPT